MPASPTGRLPSPAPRHASAHSGGDPQPRCGSPALTHLVYFSAENACMGPPAAPIDAPVCLISAWLQDSVSGNPDPAPLPCPLPRLAGPRILPATQHPTCLWTSFHHLPTDPTPSSHCLYPFSPCQAALALKSSKCPLPLSARQQCTCPAALASVSIACRSALPQRIAFSPGRA